MLCLLQNLWSPLYVTRKLNKTRQGTLCTASKTAHAAAAAAATVAYILLQVCHEEAIIHPAKTRQGNFCSVRAAAAAAAAGFTGMS
jgi:hypothetical protein